MCIFFQASRRPSTSRRLSATEQKFGYADLLEEIGVPRFLVEDETDADLSTVLVRCAVLPSLVANLPCTLCRKRTLSIRAVDRTLGMVCRLETVCTSCDKVINATLSSDRTDGNQATNAPFVVVRSAVSATMDMGVGYSGLVKFCRHLDMPVMNHTTYITHETAITNASMRVANDVMCESAQIVRRVYKELDPSIDESGVMDLMVSFDGSWMTRGHRSMYGIGCVVEVVTGLVIDFTILSLYCQRCACAASRYGGRDTDDFKKWYKAHDNCTANYTGSSNAMEKTAAEILWNNSLGKHNFRYTTMLSDGDSSTYKHVCDLKVYGAGVDIRKEECINHVAKRMGTALRNLTKDTKKTGVTLGGRGHGKLTLAAINKLTLYYGKAIRSCTGDKDAMRSAVVASFFHAASTDEEPHHNHCPIGRNSWCFFQRALAKGEEPGYHRDKVGTPLAKDVAEKVKEVYVRLGHPDLLDRCLQGKTQNANESLHSKVWLKCPKTGFVGLMRVCAATCLAIAEFNQGIGSTVTRSYAIMGLQCGSRLKVSAAEADSRRLQESVRQVQASTMEARRARKVARTMSRDASTYAPGAF